MKEDRSVLHFPVPALGTPLIVDEIVMELIERGLIRFSPGIAPTEPPGTFIPAVQVFADPSLLETDA